MEHVPSVEAQTDQRDEVRSTKDIEPSQTQIKDVDKRPETSTDDSGKPEKHLTHPPGDTQPQWDDRPQPQAEKESGKAEEESIRDKKYVD